MANYITSNEVLLNWAGEDKPAATDPVFVQFVSNTNAFTEYKFPTLEERMMVEPSYYTTLVKMVLSRVVIRAWNGAEGIDTGVSGYSFSTGPFSQSSSFDTSKSDKRGTIFFTQDDVDVLKAGVGSESSSITFNETPWSTNNPKFEAGDRERFGYGTFGSYGSFL